jgi:hypothetical protein
MGGCGNKLWFKCLLETLEKESFLEEKQNVF